MKNTSAAGAGTALNVLLTAVVAMGLGTVACVERSSIRPPEYHTVATLEEDLARLTDQAPGIAALHDIGTSRQGRTIWALKLSDRVAEDEDEPVVFIEGGIHGSEWIGTEVAYGIAAHLCLEYGHDADVTARVDGAEIWIVPLVNPDGHARVERGDFSHGALAKGRKNARDNGGGCTGVDLNRNFDYHFDEAGDPDPCDGNYRGPAPFSEPESRAVRDLLLAIVQANVPAVTLHYHSFHEVISYVASTGDPDLEQEMADLATGMHDVVFGVGGHRYEVRGDWNFAYSAGWVAGALGVPAITIELRPDNKDDLGLERGGFALPGEEVEPTVAEQIGAAMFAIDRAIGRAM